jgi:hypothetical protein
MVMPVTAEPGQILKGRNEIEVQVKKTVIYPEMHMQLNYIVIYHAHPVPEELSITTGVSCG